MGCGQHRLQEGPSQTLAGRFFSGGERGVAELPHEAMPNQVTVQAKAGTALLFVRAIFPLLDLIVPRLFDELCAVRRTRQHGTRPCRTSRTSPAAV